MRVLHGKCNEVKSLQFTEELNIADWFTNLFCSHTTSSVVRLVYVCNCASKHSACNKWSYMCIANLISLEFNSTHPMKGDV